LTYRNPIKAQGELLLRAVGINDEYSRPPSFTILYIFILNAEAWPFQSLDKCMHFMVGSRLVVEQIIREWGASSLSNHCSWRYPLKHLHMILCT
jgi:hypothetical protein